MLIVDQLADGALPSFNLAADRLYVIHRTIQLGQGAVQIIDTTFQRAAVFFKNATEIACDFRSILGEGFGETVEIVHHLSQSRSVLSGDGLELRRELLQVSQNDLDLAFVFARDFGKITAEGFDLTHNGFNSVVDGSCQLLGILSKPFDVVENPCQPLFALNSTKRTIQRACDAFHVTQDGTEAIDHAVDVTSWNHQFDLVSILHGSTHRVTLQDFDKLVSKDPNRLDRRSAITVNRILGVEFEDNPRFGAFEFNRIYGSNLDPCNAHGGASL